MSEIEFDELLDAVQTAIAPDFEEDPMIQPHPVRQAPARAANDNNRQGWPLLPFPDGWNGAC